MMKLISAIIRPHRLEPVKEALTAAGVKGVTITEVLGLDPHGELVEVYRGAEVTVDLVPQLRLDIAVDLFDAERVADVLVAAARTGKGGDGLVWISDLDLLIRTRTGQRGADAI